MKDDTVEELNALEVRLLDPASRADAEFLEQTLADDFIEIGRSGLIYDKRTTIAELLNEPGFSGQRTISTFDVREVGSGLMLAIYRVAETGTIRSSLWRRTKTGWQLAFNQGTSPTSTWPGAIVAV